MNLVAFDLSLTATGFARSLPAGAWSTDILSPPSSSGRGMRRLAWIRDEVLRLATGADLVILEGYAFGAKRQSHTRAIAEAGGVVRLALFEAGIPYAEVPPAVLKKAATGRGNAPKEDVLAAAIRRLGYGGHDHNEADALWLLMLGRLWYAAPGAPDLPKAQLSVLGKVEWPGLDDAARGPAQLALR